jgi:hypothetical protein
VEKRVLEQKRFHMLVIVGYDRALTSQTEAGDADMVNGEGTRVVFKFFYHEPESTDKEKGKFRACDEETFLSYWRGKAIFISPKNK